MLLDIFKLLLIWLISIVKDHSSTPNQMKNTVEVLSCNLEAVRVLLKLNQNKMDWLLIQKPTNSNIVSFLALDCVYCSKRS